MTVTYMRNDTATGCSYTTLMDSTLGVHGVGLGPRGGVQGALSGH